MRKVSVTYYEAGDATSEKADGLFTTCIPRVAVGMIHDNIAEASIASQVEKIIEMDDIFGEVNPITKLLWVKQQQQQQGDGSGGDARTPPSELLDIEQLTELSGDSATVMVSRQQEQLRVSQFAMVMSMQSRGLSIDSFDTRPNQCLRILDATCCNAPKGGLRRLWPGDEVVDAGVEEATLVTIMLESIPSASQLKAIPPDAFANFALTTLCDPVAVFENVNVDEVSALDRQRGVKWSGYATPCGRAVYMKNNNLKEAVRQGIPAGRRAAVHIDVVGVHEEIESGKCKAHFDNTLRNIFHLKEGAQLPKRFEPRFTPHFEGNLATANVQYGLNSDGMRSLKLVMCALAELHQDVISCPLAVPLVSLMLQYMPTIDAFACVDAMIKSSRHKNIAGRLYFLRISQSEHVSQAVVAAELVKRRFPRIAAIFQELGISLGSTLLDTINVFFTNVLPPPFVWRILDSFFNEGHKVIIRFCLALIKHLEVRIFNCETSFELINLFSAADVKNGCKHTINPQQFQHMLGFAFNLSLARQEVDLLEEHCLDATEELLCSTYSPDNFSVALRKRPTVEPPLVLPAEAALEPLFVWCSNGAGVETQWRRLFSAAADGWNLSSLYRLCGERLSMGSRQSPRDGPIKYIIVVGLSNNAQHTVVGAGLSVCPTGPASSYRGSEECFAFSLGRSGENKFASTGANRYYLLSEPEHLTLGGGGDGAQRPMLRINADLQTAVSYDCPTFDSPSFATQGEGDHLVEICNFDVYEIVF